MTRQKMLIYIVFLFGIFLLGFLSSRVSMPGIWYEDLVKPPLNPPNFVFGIVWPILYLMIAIAGARSWLRDKASVTMRFWFAQMGLNFSWSYIFFGAEIIAIALLVLVLLLACIIGFIKASWTEDKTASWLMVPYACWVSFAGYLNLSLLILN